MKKISMITLLLLFSTACSQQVKRVKKDKVGQADQINANLVGLESKSGLDARIKEIDTPVLSVFNKVNNYKFYFDQQHGSLPEGVLISVRDADGKDRSSEFRIESQMQSHMLEVSLEALGGTDAELDQETWTLSLVEADNGSFQLHFPILVKKIDLRSVASKKRAKISMSR